MAVGALACLFAAPMAAAASQPAAPPQAARQPADHQPPHPPPAPPGAAMSAPQLLFWIGAAVAAAICAYALVMAWREPANERSALFISAWLGFGLAWPIVLTGCALALLLFRAFGRRRWPLSEA